MTASLNIPKRPQPIQALLTEGGGTPDQRKITHKLQVRMKVPEEGVGIGEDHSLATSENDEMT